MKFLTDALRWLAPMGALEFRRRKLQMERLGFPGSQAVADAVASCRYDLWPVELRHPNKPWTLVDVGANEGEFSAAAARLVKLDGVHAFEPQPTCHPPLSQVLKNIPNSHLHPSAVGAEPGEIELLCTANSKLASVLKPNDEIANGYENGDFDVERRIKVPLVRLDDVIPSDGNIGLLKIDVQGYELPVLKGAARTLRRTFALLMEVNYVAHYGGGAAFDDLHEAVRQYGFRTYGVSAPYFGPNGPLWADAMFVRE